MAYKLSRTKKLVEQIELDDGTILDIDINVGEMANNFNREKNKMDRAMLLEKTPENLEAIGKASIDFYIFVLGEDNVNKLLDYYENNYVEMLDMVLPFIVEVVTPAIKEYLKGKQDKALLYKKGKKR